MQKIESYEKWEPVEGIKPPVARAVVKDDLEGLSVTLIFLKLSMRLILTS